MVEGAMSEDLSRRLKTALDETRLLILGVQVLLGFQFQVFFQDRFPDLQVSSRYISLINLLMLVLSTALLISPSMYHQLGELGDSSTRLLRATSLCAGAALAPLAVSMSLSAYVVISRSLGMVFGVICGFLLLVASILCWFGLELATGIVRGEKKMEKQVTPLAIKVDQMLTEARVIIPGAQALFGFQFIAMLTAGFDRLPSSAKTLHVVALCLVALNVTLLMTPAALHRLSYDGENSERFFRQGSAFVVVGPLPLAAGISAEMYVVFLKVIENPVHSAIAAAGAFLVLTGFWFILPLMQRSRSETSQRTLGPGTGTGSSR
jgi:hypothetical protein